MHSCPLVIFSIVNTLYTNVEPYQSVLNESSNGTGKNVRDLALCGTLKGTCPQLRHHCLWWSGHIHIRHDH